jgi:hypothetical protein
MKLSQEQMVLRHLKDYGTINCIEAYGFYSIHKLANTIHALKRRGYEFSCKQITVVNRYGEKHRIGEYSLKGDIK